MFRSFLLAYLIGSFPNAYLFTRWFKRKDIRDLGSRNAGATNVATNAGWFAGMLTLFGDVGKGYLAALLGESTGAPLMPFLTPAFAIAGHNWPVWLRFRGGGGLATFVGGCLALDAWPLALIGLALWGALYLVIRDHDTSAVQVCVLLPCLVLFTRQPIHTIALATSSSAAILLRRLQSIFERARRRRQA